MKKQDMLDVRSKHSVMNNSGRFSDLAGAYPNAAVGMVFVGEMPDAPHQLRRGSINNSTAANPVGSGEGPFLSTNYESVAQCQSSVRKTKAAVFKSCQTHQGEVVQLVEQLTSAVKRADRYVAGSNPAFPALWDFSSAVERAECNLQGPSFESKISLLRSRNHILEVWIVGASPSGNTLWPYSSMSEHGHSSGKIGIPRSIPGRASKLMEHVED